MALDTPVALFIFNRPAVTRRVFEAIAAARPRTLLVVADGPRAHRPEDAARCAETRKIVAEVDWDCTVLRNYADANLGCGKRVSSGLDWVFAQTEEVIILEDDCLPSPSFFGFCRDLLGRYRGDERVMHVGGTNFQRGQGRTPHSYYFSRYAHVWGWATWRRAWARYDFHTREWPAYRDAGRLRAVCDDPREAAHWAALFDRVHAGKIDTWDFQWLFALWRHGGLAVIPEQNLVSNLGFGHDATHTRYRGALAEMPTADLDELRHPPEVVRHEAADRFSYETIFHVGPARRARMLIQALRSPLATFRHVLHGLRPG
jgi:hypothetical protein